MRAPRNLRTLALLATLGVLAAPCGPAAEEASPRLTVTADGVRWQGAALSGQPRGGPAPVDRWWAAARGKGELSLVVRPALADTLAARGDTTRADSLLADPRFLRSVWIWDAVSRRAGYLAARGDTAGALRRLDEGERDAWLPAEDAMRKARSATYQLALRDTAAAEQLAFSAGEAGGVVPSAGREALLVLRRIEAGRPPGARSTKFEQGLGMIEGGLGEATAAARRLQRLIPRLPEERRFRIASIAITVLQRARRFREALAACDEARRFARSDDERSSLSMSRAQCLRGLGRVDSALALYTALGEHAEDTQVRMIAWWEAAREAQDQSRWRQAAQWFDRAHELSRGIADGATPRVQDAPSLAGLMYWMIGDKKTAEQRWEAWGDERSMFWLAVHRRQQGVAWGDSVLRAEFADRPGYRFYQVAARETLGVRGWPRKAAAAGPEQGDVWLIDAVQELVGPLALPKEASRLISSRDRGDPRLPARPRNWIPDSTWRSLAVALYESGDLAGATRAADRFSGPAYGDSITWAWQPWAYPPAFERELIAAADRVQVEHALLWGLTRQESRFDPRAVSRSNALGLTQLLTGTAREVAHELKEKLPADSLLFEPDRNLRYGAHYLKKLLRRFDDAAPVALTAYNAGASKVRKDWREIVDVGGWALYCEMASNSDTQQYVRNIIGFRQAYREMRPSSGVAP